MLRHFSRRSCPGYHGQVWPITCPGPWDQLTERRVPPPTPRLHPPLALDTNPYMGNYNTMLRHIDI